MDSSPRFALPFLVPGQMQKEWFHNEALQLADLLLCPIVETLAISDPPSAPVPGSAYIVAAGASGEWAGREGSLAGFTAGGWRFVAPVEGLRALVRSSGETLVRPNGVWEEGLVYAQQYLVDGLPVVQERQPGIALPAGGTVVDLQARTAIGQIIAALSAHGLIEH